MFEFCIVPCLSNFLRICFICLAKDLKRSAFFLWVIAGRFIAASKKSVQSESIVWFHLFVACLEGRRFFWTVLMFCGIVRPETASRLLDCLSASTRSLQCVISKTSWRTQSKTISSLFEEDVSLKDGLKTACCRFVFFRRIFTYVWHVSGWWMSVPCSVFEELMLYSSWFCCLIGETK